MSHVTSWFHLLCAEVYMASITLVVVERLSKAAKIDQSRHMNNEHTHTHTDRDTERQGGEETDRGEKCVSVNLVQEGKMSQ